MALFLSTFINKLDKKGRVSVPAPFRLALTGQTFQGIVAFRSYKFSAIEGMGIDRMQRLSDSVDQLDLFSEAQDDLTATIFADAHMLAFDGDGRVMFPQALLEHAKIQDSVAYVGHGATFQIWNPEAFEVHQNEARKRVQGKQATLKLRPDYA
ncbi:MAG TPA: division/cell wall cluster transcriptional repressor MraZ [Alphaproteobacteria bacterium]|nr:division/cell wall cluster transcriptional repressor MraZ [Alphaproteobacteria bacterium]